MYDLKDTGFIYVTGQVGSFLSFVLSRARRKTLIFYETEDEALVLKEEIEFFTHEDAYIFPIYTDRVFEKEDEVKRIAFLHHLASDSIFIGLFPYSAVSHALPAPDSIVTDTKTIQFGDTVFQEDIIAFLEESGYESAGLVREEGSYAKRGGIIDVFPSSSDKPIRIEFLGDEVYSIRFFDPVTQRSTKEIEKCSLTPVKTIVHHHTTIIDYVHDDMILVHKGIDHLARFAEVDQDTSALQEKLESRFHSNLNIDCSGIEGDVSSSEDVIEAVSNEDLRHIFELKKTEIFKTLATRMRTEWLDSPFVYLCTNSPHQAERLQEIFRSYDIPLPILKKIGSPEKEKEWGIIVGPLRRGFRTRDIVFLTEEDIVGPKKRVVKRTWDGFDEFLNSFKDLTVGEWVVHIDHGIGVYRGITELKIGECTKDFLVIEYQDNDKLYVPIDDLHLVQKFIGGEKHKPKVDKLGTQYWANTKKRVKNTVEDIAKELIDLYAERELAQGHGYPPEDELFREMESGFEYEETEGQIQAIDAVLGDLSNTRPMDRVVCGDVGFGKTEVALRASFKAVMDNKQVALLVPTTILAQQHYKTFRDRFKDYPMNIEMLSRFRSKDQQRDIVEDVNKGRVDIVIGTHRLLQKDIHFKDLGLLVIDEEHRFGVKHKEKLRSLKKNIDVLTLSATPIPRTLHMALTGIKDLSIISTPPLDRLAVKTHVVRFRDETIKKGITGELERGGQVFFVHNFIHNIGIVFNHLRGLLPDARIAVAHGRMDGKDLEKIMLDFIDRKYDILLSTNIIESGLDISNVNTIFINNANRMGLADLYQLRGRVGRSTKQAYAYLLVPKDEVLTKDAAFRLKIIEELTELGSGFHIANYDLEIRGAGNLLGKEQSGNVNLIGFELYCTMLEDAVKHLKDKTETVEEEIISEINIPVDAFIPDTYIADPTQKLLTYKRLSKIREESELADMRDELKDRYGNIPGPLANLLDVISLKCVLTRAGIRKLEHAPRQVILHVSEKTPIDMKRLLSLVKNDGRVKLLPDGRIIMQTDKRAGELVSFTKNVLMELIPMCYNSTDKRSVMTS
ncbi:MAG: Transcription-repair-coupling factor [Syntrophorhabdus sp. PtaU1.Bin002]|nr:MAG: Transcription-repair-coupling factor [Syntrophorhabdus sp. PtaB.Bin006]OPY67586.1 MAG: Transcription-repair-coupling factor [Syntrophorhabdus sp. PtaU1.Bin002]